MADDVADCAGSGPGGVRPLAGLTLLVVEDSRYACEGLRLFALAGGARMRRADSLASARRHLATYRPHAVLIDLGLPDGSGTELIAALARARPRVPLILATSADPAAEAAARAAGADGFLPKPVERLADFQAAVLARLPGAEAPRAAGATAGGGFPGRAPPPPAAAPAAAPDPLALRDDLRAAARALAAPSRPGEIAWAARFVEGVALAARDPALAAAARELARGRPAGLARLRGLVEARLASGLRM